MLPLQCDWRLATWLFTAPPENGNVNIYWVRLYCDDDDICNINTREFKSFSPIRLELIRVNQIVYLVYGLLRCHKDHSCVFEVH